MTIRKGTLADIPRIAAIYDRILTEEESGRAAIGWVRGVYPTEKTALDALNAGTLFVLERDGAVAASVLPWSQGISAFLTAYERPLD